MSDKKGLAFLVDCAYICCRCFLKFIKESGYMDLMIATHKPHRVEKDFKCQECGNDCGGEDLVPAVQELLEITVEDKDYRERRTV